MQHTFYGLNPQMSMSTNVCYLRLRGVAADRGLLKPILMVTHNNYINSIIIIVP